MEVTIQPTEGDEFTIKNATAAEYVDTESGSPVVRVERGERPSSEYFGTLTGASA